MYSKLIIKHSKVCFMHQCIKIKKKSISFVKTIFPGAELAPRDFHNYQCCIKMSYYFSSLI